jgi:hypothetical protein
MFTEIETEFLNIIYMNFELQELTENLLKSRVSIGCFNMYGTDVSTTPG